MDLSKIAFAVDGDSITAGSQWTKYAAQILCTPEFQNEAVGSSTWHMRKCSVDGGELVSQTYGTPDFAGISDGWMPTNDIAELQRRANNCAVVHIQKYLQKYRSGEVEKPDVFIFAMGTNDSIGALGDADEALNGKEVTGCDLFTTAGAVRWCIQSITEEFTECRIFTVLPIQTGSPAHNVENRRKAEVIKKISTALGAQVIDPTSCGICEKFENEGAPGRYLLDGLHPNEKGREMMGRFIAAQLKNMIY